MAMGSLLVKVQSHMMPSPLGRWLEGRRTRVNQWLKEQKTKGAEMWLETIKDCFHTLVHFKFEISLHVLVKSLSVCLLWCTCLVEFFHRVYPRGLTSMWSALPSSNICINYALFTSMFTSFVGTLILVTASLQSANSGEKLHKSPLKFYVFLLLLFKLQKQEYPPKPKRVKNRIFSHLTSWKIKKLQGCKKLNKKNLNNNNNPYLSGILRI